MFEQLTLAEGATGTFVETFDSGNEGGWTYGAPGEFINPAGGNPGAFLDTGTNPLLDTFAPRLRTTEPSVFTGDYRAQGVTSVGVDLIQLSTQTTTGGRPATAMLIYDNDTPGDPLDDTAAYFLGPNIPAAGDGWVSFDYDVPSQDTELPPGVRARFAIDGERSTRRDAIGDGTLDDQRAEAAHLFLEQSVCRRQLERLQRVRTDQLGHPVRAMHGGRANRSHLVQAHRHTASRELPGSLATGQAAAHDGDTLAGIDARQTGKPPRTAV